MSDWTNPADIGSRGSSLDLWNTYLRDNMTHIKEPPNEQYAVAYGTGTITSASTTFVDISSDYSVEIETFGGDLLITFSCPYAQNACFDIAINGNRLGGINGIQQMHGTNCNVNINWLHQGLEEGTYTIAIQWRRDEISGGNATLTNSYMPFFNVREFS